VRLNTGASLTFHIPAGDKGRVEVCLLLPDGSCHGNASLTYLSAPVCASIAPDSTWARLGYTHTQTHSLKTAVFVSISSSLWFRSVLWCRSLREKDRY
jgi:hypothetical protein